MLRTSHRGSRYFYMRNISFGQEWRWNWLANQIQFTSTPRKRCGAALLWCKRQIWTNNLLLVLWTPTIAIQDACWTISPPQLDAIWTGSTQVLQMCPTLIPLYTFWILYDNRCSNWWSQSLCDMGPGSPIPWSPEHSEKTLLDSDGQCYRLPCQVQLQRVQVWKGWYNIMRPLVA